MQGELCELLTFFQASSAAVAMLLRGLADAHTKPTAKDRVEFIVKHIEPIF